jgi:ketosteroid isomerase-like protein
MATLSPIAVVRCVYDALERGDVQAWIDMWTDDVTFHQTPVLPWGGTFEGKAACLAFLDDAQRHIQSRQELTQELFAAGDDVVGIGHSYGSGTQTGRTFDARWVHVWTVRGEQIAGWRLYADSAALLQAIETTER